MRGAQARRPRLAHMIRTALISFLDAQTAQLEKIYSLMHVDGA
jgi:hypothetical protein